MEFPEDVKYTSEHEWVRPTDDGYRIGITDYAQDQLGDIVFVDLPDVGTTVSRGDVMVEVESTKSVGEVYAPFTGTVSAVNTVVADQPELVNSEPYQGGWLVELIDVDEAGVEFLSAEAYQSLVE